MEQSIFAKVGKAIAVAAVILTIADFAQPIAPVAAYVIGASMIVLTVLLFAKFILKKWNETFSVLSYFSAMSFVMALILFVFQNQSDEAKQSGLIASKLPGLVEPQKSLGMVEKQLGQIADSAKSIDRKMDNVTKEVSNNPRKELSNLGMDWSALSMYNAASAGDLKSLTLFLKGGMRADTVIAAHNASVIDHLIENNPPSLAKVLTYFKKHGFDFDKKVQCRIRNKESLLEFKQLRPAEIAIIKGNMVALKFLKDNNAKFEDIKNQLKNKIQATANKMNHFCYHMNYNNPRNYYVNNSLESERRKLRRSCRQIVSIRSKDFEVKEYKSMKLAYQTLIGKEFVYQPSGDKNQALENAILSSDVAAVKWLLKNGANPNHRVKDSDNSPVLSFAREIEKPAIILQALIDAGADVKAKGASGEMPIHVFVRSAQFDAVEVLIKAKANLSAKTVKNETPVYIATRLGRAKILKLLLDNAADANIQSQDQQETALFLTVKWNKPILAEILLKGGANPDMRDEDQRTPLMHIADERGKNNMSKLLLKYKADPNAKDKNGRTPISIASSGKNEELLKLMKK